MKIQFIFPVGLAFLQASPSHSAGVRNGHLVANFDEFLQETHGKSCRHDSDCPSGTHCNTVKGTQYYHTCFDDVDDDDAWNYFPSGGQCSRSCTKDSDCQKGGFNPCGSCGQYTGTIMYHKCYAPEPNTPTPTPWNYFPNGGQCSKSCRNDSDCQKGGYNPCGSCGKYSGTLMYHKCYAPNDEDMIAE
eukprot:scaffold58624_cov81-Cyclotella_meneghiniana.AAC.6